MKRLVVIIGVLMLFLVSNVLYASQFGPPEPAAKEGQASLGIGYFNYSGKWKPKDDDWETVNTKQNQIYLQVSYGFVKNGEIYLRIGGGEAKIKKAFLIDEADFRDSKPFGTIGIKGISNVTPSFGIGPFLPEYGITIPAGTYTLTETEKVKEPWDINIGVGLQGKIGETILYGGPFIYWGKSKADYKISVTGPLTGTYLASTTYKEKNNVGGFAGLRLSLAKGLNLEVEGQLKSKFSMGGALTYSF